MTRPPRTLRGVQPSAGVRATYQGKMLDLVRTMTEEVKRRVAWAYRTSGAAYAADELPASELERITSELTGKWNARFNRGADDMAKWFAQSVEKRSTKQLMRILRDAGFSVDFKMTRAMQDVLRATIKQNTALIKSIPQKYMLEVQGIVMRGAQSGRDLAAITHDLEKQAGVTRRRAEFIARDQSNKATAAITRTRQLEAGITEAVWVHSGGGHEKRPTHVEASKNRTKYDVAKGWYDPAVQEYILPGTLPGCRCFSRPVVAGFEP